MQKDLIIKICREYKDEFYNKIKDIKYESKGIFNSEMLLCVAILKKLKIKEIWESGRARGQSTKILAENFKDDDVQIYSIEINKNTENDVVAKNRLKDYKNLHLIYGDSTVIFQQKIENPSIILIDGPKGDTSFNLILNLIENKNIKAFFIHDCHKDSPHRKLFEEKFQHIFFSDDMDFVKEFRDLDNICWESKNLDKKSFWTKPYHRGNREMQSYAPTLGVIFNI